MRASRSFVVLAFVILLMPAATHAQSGGLRYSIAVSEFDNQSTWHGQWAIGNAWSEIMTDLLSRSGHFVVVGNEAIREAALNEQDLGASGLTAQGKNTPASGALTPAQLLLRGTITYVQTNSGEQDAGINLGKIQLGGGKKTAEIGATIHLVDSSTGQVVASDSVRGVSKSRRGSIRIRDGNRGLHLSGKKDDNLEKAMADAAEQSIEWLATQLPNVQWSGTVVTVDAGEVVVDRGAREGVQAGQIFNVGTAEVIRSPDTGQILDERLKKIAQVQVTQVKPMVSYCTVLSGDPRALHKGLSIQLP